MIIGIPISENAYTPESYAYKSYLENLGHTVQLDFILNPNNDINLYFMGMMPFWNKHKGRSKIVHEYHSLSTPPYAHIKNRIKKIVNKKPDGRIFLSHSIYRDLRFEDDIPFIYRGMGIDEELFQKSNENPDYDIVYCGSVSGRIGLIETLLGLAKSYKVLVVGKVTKEDRVLLNFKNITLMGIVNREILPEVYRNVRFGLNFTPDIYPYNIQTSTKTLEYLASGLGVISNKYEWSERFFKEINYQPIWLESISSSNFLCSDSLRLIDPNIVNEYSWSNILSRSNLEGFLRDCLNEKK